MVRDLWFRLRALSCARSRAGDLLYDVPAIDPVTYLATAFAVTLVALVAMVLPARRAMRMDPMQALRTE